MASLSGSDELRHGSNDRMDFASDWTQVTANPKRDPSSRRNPLRSLGVTTKSKKQNQKPTPETNTKDNAKTGEYFRFLAYPKRLRQCVANVRPQVLRLHHGVRVRRALHRHYEPCIRASGHTPPQAERRFHEESTT